MAKGRKTIPSKIIELRGGTTHTHRPPRNDEPEPPERMPSCPRHLDKEARKEWRRTAKILKQIGLLTELDRAVLTGYCQSWSEYVSATLEAQRMGSVYKKSDGTPGINPYVRLAREAYDRMMKAAVLLGLSPSSRAGLKVEKPKPQSKAAAFRERKKGGVK